MLIPWSSIDSRSPATVWRNIFLATWWLTVVLAIAALVTAPFDFFASENPLEADINVGDRIANAILVVLVQNVVLAMLLFAAQVVRLLEEGHAIARQGNLSLPRGSNQASPDAGVVSPKSPDDEAAIGIWYCDGCRSRNGRFDSRCWNCHLQQDSPSIAE